MSLQNVKAFYERLATDEAFRIQLEAVKSKEECSQIVKNSGYDFTQEEFEEYTALLLESNSDNDEIKDLDEKELEAVFGGASSSIDVDRDFSNGKIDLSLYKYLDLDKFVPPIDISFQDVPLTIQASYGAVVGEGLQLIEILTNDDSLNEFAVNHDLPKH